MNGKLLRILAFLVVFSVLALGSQGCRHTRWTKELSADTQKYLACNVWIKDGKIWSTGYQVGGVIPAGSKVNNIKLGEKSGYPVVGFTTVEDSQAYFAYFNPKHHPGITAQDYMDRLFTSKGFDEMTKGMTDKEIKAIKTGDVVLGMSSDAVLVSWGYPPETGTRSIDFGKWKFWESRFNTVEIRFDNDKVVEILD